MRPNRKQGRVRHRRRIRKARLLALLTVLGLLGSVSFGFGLITAIAGELPKLDPSRQLEQQVNGYIYAAASEGSPGPPRVLAVLRGSEARTLVDLDEINPWMRHAIVAVEDRRYWEHRGVDIRGIGRALWADIRQQKVVEGGSTITQQFVKNALDRNQKTIARKVREAALAWQLTQRWSKRRILAAYLNTIYFGNGAYGVQQASLTYFDHGAGDLTVAEAALLAGMPGNPTAFDPVSNPQAARGRRLVVLQAMVEEGKITRQQLAAAAAEPLPRPQDVKLPGTEGPAQYFVNYVKRQLIDEYGADRVFGGGLEVQTTIDLDLQRAAREAIVETLTDPDGPSAALVAIDPRDGSVKAMVGGSNYRKSQFNLAVQSERQPGSAFKPFVLATALRQGISPATRFESKPQEIDLGDRTWVVANYNDVYYGSLDLERATIESDNAVYAQLTRLVGSRKVAETASALGIQSALQGYFSIGLGTESVNPLELARAYAAFANDGSRIDGAVLGNRPRVIDSITEGGTERRNAPVGKRVLASADARTVNSILQKVVSEGTGVRAQMPDRPVAGKTGTTENYGDAWFVGYTPELVVAVWVGYPETLQPMLTEFDGDAVAGGTYPAEIWKAFAEVALEGEEPEAFAAPPYRATEPKLVSRRGDRLLLDNGICPSRQEVVYFAGRGPQTSANCRADEVEVPDVVGQTLAAAESRLTEQPLTADVVYKPAAVLQRAGIVVDQRPKRGFAAPFDTVILVVTKPVQGVIPNLVGRSLGDARTRLERLGLEAEIAWVEGAPEQVLEQRPKAGLAAVPGLKVRLVVARG
ncbi:MAG: PBP1A family penicillin-binding protein [Actinobacteria bacterium]|nr:PBP1A family penicillin-binding protein [Actinomycetota bacterium]